MDCEKLLRAFVLPHTGQWRPDILPTILKYSRNHKKYKIKKKIVLDFHLETYTP